jgi:WD40 repeat protein
MWVLDEQRRQQTTTIRTTTQPINHDLLKKSRFAPFSKTKQPKFAFTTILDGADVYFLELSIDGQYVFIGGRHKDHTAMLGVFNMETGAHIQWLSGHAGCVWTIAASPRGDVVASGDDNVELFIWNADASWELRRRLNHPPETM